MALSGDSVGVLDAGTQRLSVLGPALDFARSVTLPGSVGEAVLVRDGWLAVNGALVGRDGLLAPLHYVRWDFDHALLTRSFGRIEGEHDLRRVMSVGPRGELWVATVNGFRLERWNQQGELERQVTLDPEVFGDLPGGSIGTPSQPPSSFITALEVDEDGRVWLVATVPDRNWKAAWSGIRLEPGRELTRATRPRRRRLFDTLITVFSPEGEVLLQHSLDAVVVDAWRGSFATTHLDRAGEPVIEIWRAVLRTHEGRR